MGPRHHQLKRRCAHACSFGALLCSLTPPTAHAQRARSGAASPALRFAVSSAASSALGGGGSTLPDSPGSLQAQSSAGESRVVGTIYDVNGGLVPGASITVLDKAGKDVGSATSDSTAHFEVTGIPPGTYRIKVMASGLKSFEAPAITLKAGEVYMLPETALPIATTSQTVDVVMTQEMIADQEIADETKQRVLGIFPNFYTSYEWNAAPLNARQKFKVASKAAFDPLLLATTAGVAGVQQLRGSYPEFDTGPAGYGERFGAQLGNALVGRFIGSAILPSIFHQDPRYFYMGPPSTTGQRFRHAVAFSVSARSDKGHDGHLMPNYSHILGNFIAGYISRTYHPGSNNGIGLAVDNALIGVGGGAIQGLTREFLFRGISRHTPKYAKGKPVGVDPVEDLPAPRTPAAAKPAAGAAAAATPVTPSATPVRPSATPVRP